MRPRSYNPSLVLKQLSFLAVLLLLISCGSGQALTAEEQQALESLTEKVNTREITIVHQWADPLSGGNINLIGNTNLIKLEGDSVEVYLPYYGVRHSGGGPGTEGGIKYEGPAENFRVQENSRQRSVQLSFEAENKDNEHLKFLITLFPNGNATTSVTTSQRSAISYRGKYE